MALIKKPTSTSSSGGWTAVGAATLHDALVEDIADGGTSYIACGDGTTAKLDIEAFEFPNRIDGFSIQVTAQTTDITPGLAELDVRLMQGATVVKTITLNPTNSFVDSSFNVDEAEAALIDDSSSLAFEVEDIFSTVATENQVTRLVLSIPDKINKISTIS